MYEAYEMILLQQVEALINLGAQPRLKVCTLDVRQAIHCATEVAGLIHRRQASWTDSHVLI